MKANTMEENSDSMEIIQKINERIQKNGVPQKQLQNHLEISHMHYWRLMNGKLEDTEVNLLRLEKLNAFLSAKEEEIKEKKNQLLKSF
ncbi:MAG: hypothetical protein ACRCVT_10125 [Leadbetterella sp.]